MEQRGGCLATVGVLLGPSRGSLLSLMQTCSNKTHQASSLLAHFVTMVTDRSLFKASLCTELTINTTTRSRCWHLVSTSWIRCAQKKNGCKCWFRMDPYSIYTITGSGGYKLHLQRCGVCMGVSTVFRVSHWLALTDQQFQTKQGDKVSDSPSNGLRKKN